ncbi:lycopene cyclase family protein [Corynebacterium glyciniphilum]|uniref:lycopene cyclase family protein n=1 Tax=Corynebacterium glyciniphilum TaxID=1404244 RepID=UPI00235416AF
MHIAVIGLGPAGALLAHRAAAIGWTVDGYDPRCEVTPAGGLLLPQWTNTYGVFLDGLPPWTRSVLAFSAVSSSLDVNTPRRRALSGRPYGIIDRDATRGRLTAAGNRLRLHRRRITDLSPEALGVEVVVDCRGVVDRPGDIRQIAYGVVLESPAGLHSPAVFMDWRPACPDEDSAEPPSFLYVQPVEAGTLYEETVLVTRQRTRPMIDLLKQRLAARVPGTVPVSGPSHVITTETVHFPVARRARGWYTGLRDGVAVFGAAGGMTHPATGYSVAESAATVDRMLHLLDRGSLPWQERFSAALAYRLRLFGAELVTMSDGSTLQQFFDAFFDLPPRRQTFYLAGQHGGRVAVTMLSLARFPRRVLPFLRPVPRVLWGMAVGRSAS